MRTSEAHGMAPKEPSVVTLPTGRFRPTRTELLFCWEVVVRVGVGNWDTKRTGREQLPGRILGQGTSVVQALQKAVETRVEAFKRCIDPVAVSVVAVEVECDCH